MMNAMAMSAKLYKVIWVFRITRRIFSSLSCTKNNLKYRIPVNNKSHLDLQKTSWSIKILLTIQSMINFQIAMIIFEII